MKILADEVPAQPRGHHDVCSVTHRALSICKYYKQCSFNCFELGFCVCMYVCTLYLNRVRNYSISVFSLTALYLTSRYTRIYNKIQIQYNIIELYTLLAKI